MRLLILLSLFFVAATGYCTGVYVETAEDHQPGIIQPGDVFEYYCELPSTLPANQPFSLEVIYPNGELFQALLTPYVLREVEVLYP